MRRATSALVALAALLALSATPSFHGHLASPAASAIAAPGAGAFAAEGERGRVPHGADLRPICRAGAQARCALVVARAGLALADASLPFHLPAPAAPARAPALRSSAPRAPPAPSALDA